MDEVKSLTTCGGKAEAGKTTAIIYSFQQTNDETAV
jgi:hypothetical protein